ncbi:MAG TPA: DolP-mannose mannosyltransferase [Blastocatellia bacterium]
MIPSAAVVSYVCSMNIVGETTGIEKSPEGPAAWIKGRALSAIWVLALVGLLAGFARQATEPDTGDNAIWDYVAQSIVRGQIPYRDVVEIKTPGSAYVSALATVVGARFGARDIIAVRVVNLLMLGLLLVVTYVLAARLTRSRAAAAIAALATVPSISLMRSIIGGTQPKLLMALAGLLSLYFIERRRPFWSGVFSMLSALCWQPGLLFSGVAAIVFLRRDRPKGADQHKESDRERNEVSNHVEPDGIAAVTASERGRRLVAVLVGAAAPLALTAAYFAYAHSLRAFWTWTVEYNFSVYAPSSYKGVALGLNHIFRVSSRLAGWRSIFLIGGLLGLVVYGALRISPGSERLAGARARLGDAGLIASVIYVLFCLIDFQGGPYLIPLLPLGGIYSAFLLTVAAQYIGRHVPRLALKPSMAEAAGQVAALVWFGVLLVVTLTAPRPNVTLNWEDHAFDPVRRLLKPGDQIYAHGSVEVLVMLNRPNLNPYIFFDQKRDDYVGAMTKGGFAGFMADLAAAAPKFVSISRLQRVSHSKELMDWVTVNYDRLPIGGFDIYERKDNYVGLRPVEPSGNTAPNSTP